MKLWQQFETDLEQARQSLPGGPQGWRPERLIFRDWWLWKDQEFGFAHGRLALTGQNAGGKSSVLALTIPMLLDGRTDPIRLDPAQSRDRFLHYYLLGPDDAEPGNPDVFRYEARTGYVALEFRHVTQGRYLTIGMGVTGSRTTARRIVDWWGFVLLAGQRLGRTFDVRGADDACLGRREFTRLVGETGLVLTERSEYQHQVNQQLFGFEADDYQALIDMLLQARRPKLGEQTGPDKVCELLSQALPAIPADRLARVGEVVNNIEEYRRNLADVEAKAEAVGRLDRALLAVAEARGVEAAQQYQEAQSHYGSVSSRLRAARESQEQAEQTLALLEQQAGERAIERAERQAEEAQLSQGEGADLQQALTQAKEQEGEATDRTQQLAVRITAAQAEAGSAARAREESGNQFTARRRALVTRLQGLHRAMSALAWQEGVTAVRTAVGETEVLAVDDPGLSAGDAAPSPGLVDRAEELRQAFLQAASARDALDRTERTRDQVAAEIEALRGAVSRSLDAAEQAKDLVEERGEDVIAALQKWQEDSAVLEPGDLDLVRVNAAIRDRIEPETGGYRELIRPLLYLGDRRRQELRQARADREEEWQAARVEQRQIEEKVIELQTDAGDPGRTEVREAARLALGDRTLPLFRQARFCAGVDAATAVRVETALLEAGWLDLLTGEVAGADAFLLPGPPLERSLLAVLEPEPGAPPAVRAILASIGWGEGHSDCWVAPDGRWRNGPARGQVAPWAPAEAGYIGADARERRRTRRVEVAQVDLADAAAAVAALTENRRWLDEQLNRLEEELRRLDDLPWQSWFNAVAAMRVRIEAWEQVRAKLEAEKPRLAQADQAVDQAAARLDQALVGLPGAASLDVTALRGRAEDFLGLKSDLENLPPLYREMGEIGRSHAASAERLNHAELVCQGLKQDLQSASVELAAKQARVRMLSAAIADPDLKARLAKLEQVRGRLRELGQAEEQARTAAAEARARQQAARENGAALEPEERDWGQKRAARLEQLKERLQMHVALEPHLDGLAKSGPVSYLPRLLKLVEGEEIQAALHARRDALMRLEYEERNRLADYSPTPGEDTLLFRHERLPLKAHQLRERLAVQVREYEGLLEEEQRKLFQDIIYEGILDELRRLIRQAREFARRTSKKLERPLSNGEVLSLRWSPVPAERVPAAKIGAALDQMEQGSRYLSEEKREVLLSTIKEEVERVRAVAKAAGYELSYHEAVAQALDYRRWYEFQLLSRMPGTTGAVPIRTRGFGRRSNSAKAWALTVPILAAVAARYDASPRDDVPRLIGLDEAFAGLDPNNQETYLSFLTDMGFSWILTIPDEVPYSHKLSAVMTYRLTLEGNFHTGFPILWNGNAAYEPMADWTREAAAVKEE